MKKQYDIVGNRKKFFIFSAVLIVFILLFSVIFGVEMDIQFKGGDMAHDLCFDTCGAKGY